ncbi:MAG: MBOAT family protein [Deltaproteobacteria bacterium]|nr:MBOAT family protein [Deltaproteobacteria bacterium]
MIFSSPRFLLFLAVMLLLLAPRWRLQVKLHVLLVGSCFFYAAWDYRYLALLLFVSVANYVCGARIADASDERGRKLWLWASVAVSLGTLAYFKYTGFFLDTLRPALALAGVPVPELDILLPAGVSFYTFKTMSYTIDVYRRELEACRSITDYATFVTFFPELIAGPIVRASIFLPQMGRVIGPTAERLRIGASIFLLGLTKKLLIADPMASVADPIFASPETYATPTIWMGVLAYTLQIYCDFSGYSDMAIGVAKMIGYDLPENFRMPYLARDVAEFWRRWHITLSTWLRDYLYIPLGGNRHGPARTYLNLMATMLLGGLWHGSSWNFVLWGALHGIGLAVHRWLRDRNGGYPLLPHVVAVPTTFVFVMLCWVPFRAPDFRTTAIMLERMFVPGAEGVLWIPTLLLRGVLLIAAGHALGSLLEAAAERGWREGLAARLLRPFGGTLRHDAIAGWYVDLDPGRVGGAFVLVLCVLLIFFYAPTGTSPFIYFRF